MFLHKNDLSHNRKPLSLLPLFGSKKGVLNRLILKYELDLDFVLIAVTSSLKDYTLCFKINKQLNTNFHKIEELSLSSRSSSSSFFSRYFYQIPNSDTEFYLLANKGTESYLIPEMKRVDYFILIKNFIDQEDLNYIIDGLNKLQEVVVAAEVDPEKLKSKENLIF
nr:IPExxxVDY family protein [Pedobacter sp. SYSU D00823]